MALSTAQIGKCGELLVQYQLLCHGIESAPMSTDTGIDLVAYSPNMAKPVTVQVKTNLKPKPGGGRGKAALDWRVSASSPAQYVAFVDLATQSIWLMSLPELEARAQQRSSGRLHFYMYTDASTRTRQPGRLAHEFEGFKLFNRVSEVFGT